MKYKNRMEAGQLLAKQLATYHNQPNAIVLALPRGGVPIGYEIAQQLHLPLDILLVRKLASPTNPEYAMGAIALDNVVIFNDAAIKELQITEQEIDEIIIREDKELWRRNQLYRQGKAAPVITHKTILLVDDGLATGSTMRAAIKGIKKLKPQRLIIAVPVAAPTICSDLQEAADEVICLQTPTAFESVGDWYEQFEQISDQEVIDLLATATKFQHQPAKTI